MKLNRIQEVIAKGENGSELRLRFANRGEPYREGYQIEITSEGHESTTVHSVFLDEYETKILHRCLGRVLEDQHSSGGNKNDGPG